MISPASNNLRSERELTTHDILGPESRGTAVFGQLKRGHLDTPP